MHIFLGLLFHTRLTIVPRAHTFSPCTVLSPLYADMRVPVLFSHPFSYRAFRTACTFFGVVTMAPTRTRGGRVDCGPPPPLWAAEGDIVGCSSRTAPAQLLAFFCVAGASLFPRA